jgi:MFS family permease
MQTGLELNNEAAGWIATANLSGYLVFSILGGALAARFGTRLIATLGLIAAGLGMVMTGMAQNLPSVMLWRALTGFGSGAAYISIMGIWAAWFTPARRGMAAGIAVTGASFALIATGSLAPWFIKIWGATAWRICWYVFGGASLSMALIALLILRNRPAELGLQPLGAGQEPAPPGKPKPQPKREWKQVYFSATVWQIGIVYAATGFAYIIFMTFFAKHLVMSGSFTTQSAGQLFMIMGWIGLGSGFLWGTISDKIGRKSTIVILFLLQAIAYALFAMRSTSLLIVASIISSLISGSIAAIMAALCADLFAPAMVPAAIGFVTVFFGLGQAAGPVVAGIIADKMGSFSPAFMLAALVALLGAIGAFFLIRPIQQMSPNCSRQKINSN